MKLPASDALNVGRAASGSDDAQLSPRVDLTNKHVLEAAHVALDRMNGLIDSAVNEVSLELHRPRSEFGPRRADRCRRRARVASSAVL